MSRAPELSVERAERVTEVFRSSDIEPKAELTIRAFAQGGFGVYDPRAESVLWASQKPVVPIYAAANLGTVMEFVREKLQETTQPRPDTTPKPAQQDGYLSRGQVGG